MDENKDPVQDIIERLVKIETLLTADKENRKAQFDNIDEKLKVANHRISDLEGNQKWGVCAILGGLITFIYSLFKLN